MKYCKFLFKPLKSNKKVESLYIAGFWGREFLFNSEFAFIHPDNLCIKVLSKVGDGSYFGGSQV